MKKYITSEIERRRAELKALDERRLVLTSQLSVLEDLLARAPDADEPRRARSARMAGRSADQRRLGARWMPVLTEAVRRHPRTVRGDEVPDIQRSAGQEPAEAGNIRSHFWANAKPGKFYERVATNEYRATEAGAKLVGLPLGEVARNNNGAEHEGSASLVDFESSDEPRPDKSKFDLLNHNAA